MKTAILISSCDAFSDCWAPMIFSLEKFWSDCPFSIYFISNKNKIDNDKVKFINVGEDKGFASNLSYALDKIDSDFIIYFQEDYFLVNKVNTDAIVNHVNHCIENSIDFLKVHGNDHLLRDKFRIKNSDYCKNPIDVRYSINTSIAIWKKESLVKLCVEGYSGWEWERNIISYINENDIVINSEILHSSCYKEKSVLSLPGGAVAKGRWTKKGVDFLNKYGFKDVIAGRDIEGTLITSLAVFYNQHPKSLLRYPIVIILRLLLKFKINI